MKKAYLLSLGCSRNLLDSEVLLGLLEKAGITISDTAEDADVAIVNTCGFIQDAKEESIDAILQLAELKKAGKIEKIVITGCLPQRYPDELMNEIKEIDGVFGTSDFTKIPAAIGELFADKKINEIASTPEFLYDHLYDRKLLTASHYAYVKIQEGCSNRCSYCVIPDLKGPRRSRTIDSIVEEVRKLKKLHNIKEIILIGQDTTSFGLDTTGKMELVELLNKVSSIMEDGWVRLLYTHPVHFSDELVDAIAGIDNVCKYVDLPIQHINDRILKQMNRRVEKKDIAYRLLRLREQIKDVAIRTSIIVGFPGETDEEFTELLDFLREAKFDRLGAFIYSKEEGTPAAEMDDQVPDDVKKKRFDEVMKLQQEISSENNLKYYDKVIKVIIDEKDEGTSDQFVGRSQMDAPEVDGVVYVKGDNITVGDIVDVKITGAMEYDLVGEKI